MSLTEILLEEFKKIEDETELRKQEVDYIKELTEKNSDMLVDCSEENADRKAYDLIKNALIEVEKLYEDSINVIYDIGVKEGLVKRTSYLLGWTEIRQNKENERPFALYPTELGEKVYNGLRKLRAKNRKPKTKS